MESALKKAKPSGPTKSKYIDLSWIYVGSIFAESFFSACKYVLSDHRRSLLPVTFEQIVFLKYNRRFWDEMLVHDALGLAKAVDGDDDDDDDEAEEKRNEEIDIDGIEW